MVSAVSLQRHYARSATNFCDFNEKFSCDIVNRSEYSTMAGIPVPAIGIAGYAGLFPAFNLLEDRAPKRQPTAGGLIGGVSLRAVSDLRRSL